MAQVLELFRRLARITNGSKTTSRFMELTTTTSDYDLLRRILAGDEGAFTELYRRRQGGIYRFAMQMSGSRSIAEDVTQEVFMTIVRDPISYDPARGPLASYLYGIARNHVLRRLERERLFVPFAEADEENENARAEVLRVETDPLADLTRNEMIETVRGAVLALPAHYREAVVLCDLHEMSYAEAANVVGCAVGTIRSRLHRARALLVEKLRASGNRGPASQTANPVRCFA
jgi:RNA polymerase sigma-70 factor (ECF subfamily)